jgi:hypothetical protein
MALLQRRNAVGVIRVMMRHQNVGQLPASALQRFFHRSGFRRIDGGGCPARRVMEQNPVIVLQTQK